MVQGGREERREGGAGIPRISRGWGGMRTGRLLLLSWEGRRQSVSSQQAIFTHALSFSSAKG